MSILSRLFGGKPDPREDLRPLWHRVVAISRETHWYADCGVADTVEGRFDMITAVLALVLLRLEGKQELVPSSVFLTELFVEDMDGQLREKGVGDLVVGKHVGKLMAAMGGRLGAFREALAEDGDAALSAAVERNVNLIDGANGSKMATALRELAARLTALDDEALLAGAIPDA